MGSTWAVAILTLGASFEFVADQLPATTGAYRCRPTNRSNCYGPAYWCLPSHSWGVSLVLGALFGAIGAIAGAFGGYRARVGLVRALGAPDFAIAIPEDLVAVGLGIFLVSRF